MPHPSAPVFGEALIFELDTDSLRPSLTIALVLAAVCLVALWRIFTKMGQPGWSGAIPILNWTIIARLSGKSWWYGLLPLLPCIGPIWAVILLYNLAKLFGWGAWYTVGLVLLPFVFLPVLAWGRSQYLGPNQRLIGSREITRG